jgi:hypothetical protein
MDEGGMELMVVREDEMKKNKNRRGETQVCSIVTQNAAALSEGNDSITHHRRNALA